MYNSRLLLDPSMIQYVANRADRNVQFNNELSNRNADSIRSLLESAGKTAGEYRQEQERRNAVSEWDVGTDPFSRAALIDWFQNGNTAGLGQVKSLENAYQMQKMAAEQRKIDDYNRKKSMEWHDKLAFMNNLKAYQDETDPRAREILKQTLQHDLDTHPDWGNSEQINAMEQARLDKIEQEKQNKIDEDERLYRVAQFTNTLPKTFAKEADKDQYYESIKNNPDMTTSEKTTWLNKLGAIESGSTQKKKSTQSADAAHAGNKKTDALKKADALNTAKTYVGQTMNSLEWEDIPEEVRAFLTRNGHGEVSLKE